MTTERHATLLLLMALSALATILALLGVVRPGLSARHRLDNAVTLGLWVIIGWFVWVRLP